MSALTQGLRALRSRPITFDLDGETVEISPPTLGQATAAVRLEVDTENDSAAQRLVRFERQARLILGPQHAHLVDRLNQEQIAEIVGALYVAANGMDPVAYVRWQQAQKRAGIKLDALKVLQNLDNMVIELAAQMGIRASDAEQEPLADAAATLERMAKIERQRVEVQAVIAGRKITWN